MREEKVTRTAAASLIILPLVFTAVYFSLGEALAQTALYYGLACTAVGIAAGWLLGKRHTALQIAASALPAAALALIPAIPSPSAELIRIVMAALGALMAVCMERRFISPAGPPGAGLLFSPLVVLLAVSLVLLISSAQANEAGSGVRLLIIVMGAAWLFAAVFMLNRAALRQAAYAQTQGEVPPGARRSGTAGTLIFLAAVFILANIGPIVRFIGDAIRKLIEWIIAAIAFFGSLFPKNDDAAPAPAPTDSGDFFKQPGGNGSDFWDILLWVVGAALILAAAVAVGYGLYKGIPKLWKRLKKALGSLFATWRDEDRGYSDRAESLMSLRQALTNAGSRIKKIARVFRRNPRLADFRTNAGKARFLFREYLHGLASARREPPPGATATEIARSAPALASAYNPARYGEEEPSDEEIIKARESVDL